MKNYICAELLCVCVVLEQCAPRRVCCAMYLATVAFSLPLTKVCAVRPYNVLQKLKSFCVCRIHKGHNVI